MAYPPIQLVVFDWAGTTVDHGCFAPVAAFIESFARFGVRITSEQARGPMGLHKKDHLQAIAGIPEVADHWRGVHDRDWNERDIDCLFGEHFVPLLLESAVQHSRVVPGLLQCVDDLRAAKLKIGTSTGYFREAAERVYAFAGEQGYKPDNNVCADDVLSGRPAPWMIFRNMERLGVYPPQSVIKVGDTLPDIEEGLNAGVWSVGVTHTSSDVGCTAEELASLNPAELDRRIHAAQQKLTSAGAHFVIDSVADLPELIERVNQSMHEGEKP